MIYYVEDDRNIRELVIYTLQQSGLAAQGFADAVTFWAAMGRERAELVLLDLMLPGEDGITILKRLRGCPETEELPVILVTAKGAEYDKVVGLDTGADDYIVKPFGMMELVSRVKARLRRIGARKAGKELKAGRLYVSVERHQAAVDGQPVTLTYKEFELLRFLLENRGIVFDREQLLERVWGYGYDGGTRTVDVHVQTLRQKLGDCGELIETVRGVGYRLGEKTL